MAQFACPECGQGFAQQAALESHRQTSHPSKSPERPSKAGGGEAPRHGVSPVRIAALFKGADFPMSADQLKAFVRDKHPDAETWSIIEHFSDKHTYQNMADVEREAGRHI